MFQKNLNIKKFVFLLLGFFFSISIFAQNNEIAQNPETATASDILIFVSFSMPDASLQQWISQAQKLHASLVIRGLYHDSFPDTQAKIAALSNGQGSIILEPRLFTDYSITQVPAVVVRNTSITCSATQSCSHQYPYDVVTGDIGLEAALNTIANQDDSSTKSIAQKALETLQNPT